jgi:hypothetical protein
MYESQEATLDDILRVYMYSLSVSKSDTLVFIRDLPSSAQDELIKQLVLRNIRQHAKKDDIETLNTIANSENITFIRDSGITQLARTLCLRGKMFDSALWACVVLVRMRSRGLIHDTKIVLEAAVESINKGLASEKRRRRFVSHQQAKEYDEMLYKRIRMEYLQNLCHLMPLLDVFDFEDISTIKASIDAVLLPVLVEVVEIEKNLWNELLKPICSGSVAGPTPPLQDAFYGKFVEQATNTLTAMYSFHVTRKYLEENVELQKWLASDDNFPMHGVKEFRKVRRRYNTMNIVPNYYDMVLQCN